MKYIKVAEELEIEYVGRDGHDELVPSFVFDNCRYYLDDFIRTHNNPWVSDNFPDYIHGFHADSYFYPLFIELVGSDAVNVYREA